MRNNLTSLTAGSCVHQLLLSKVWSLSTWSKPRHPKDVLKLQSLIWTRRSTADSSHPQDLSCAEKKVIVNSLFLCSIASSDLQFQWSFGSHLLFGMPLGLKRQVFFSPDYFVGGDHQWGSRKIGLMKNGVQNIPVISHSLVEDCLQRCTTYSTL